MIAPTKQEILTQLQPIFQEAMDSPRLVVDAASSAINTPNWDSLAHIEMIELVERHFGVRFALSELQNLKTVNDLIELISKKHNS